MARRKDDEDAVMAAERRTARTGRSFFPAANIQGIRLSSDAMRGIPSRNAITDTGQGLESYGSQAGSAGFRGISPNLNPTYQAALAKGRPSRSGYEMIQTPSGGSMSVPLGRARSYTDMLYKGNPTADTGFQRPNAQAAYALGNTGAVPTGNTPYERSYRMGYEGGAVSRPESPGLGFQIGQAIPGIASGVGNKIAGFFGGVGKALAGFGAGSTNAGMYQPPELNQPTNFGMSYNPKPNESMFPNPVASRQSNPWQSVANLTGYGQQPRRYFD